MELFIKLGILAFLFLIGIVFYFVLMTAVFPKLLKIHHSVDASADRGLKKYIYPEGRGIAYEPHPMFRKYVHQYVLYTENGYKYLKCKLDVGVERLSYSVIMFDRYNRVIDVLDVAELNITTAQTQDVDLHSRTSYIALLLNSVNGDVFARRPLICCRLWRLSVFSLAVGAVSFVQMFAMKYLLAKCDDIWLHLDLTEEITTFSMAFFAFFIGVIAGVIAFFSIRKKGVMWTK